MTKTKPIYYYIQVIGSTVSNTSFLNYFIKIFPIFLIHQNKTLVNHEYNPEILLHFYVTKTYLVHECHRMLTKYFLPF